MSASQRAKGRRGELELAGVLADAGLDAELNYGQEERGGGLGDVTTEQGRFECKRRKALPRFLSLADGVRVVAFREDRGSWRAMLRLDDLLGLLRREREALASAAAMVRRMAEDDDAGEDEE